MLLHLFFDLIWHGQSYRSLFTTRANQSLKSVLVRRRLAKQFASILIVELNLTLALKVRHEISAFKFLLILVVSFRGGLVINNKVLMDTS